MSHFTSMMTRLVEKVHLIQALRDLGYVPQEGRSEVQDFAGNRMAVELKIATGNTGYDIGFRKFPGGYEVVADWWGIKDIDRERFVQKLNQRYAYLAAREKLEKQGFSLASEEVRADGEIHLVLRRMA